MAEAPDAAGSHGHAAGTGQAAVGDDGHVDSAGRDCGEGVGEVELEGPAADGGVVDVAGVQVEVIGQVHAAVAGTAGSGEQAVNVVLGEAGVREGIDDALALDLEFALVGSVAGDVLVDAHDGGGAPEVNHGGVTSVGDGMGAGYYAIRGELHPRRNRQTQEASLRLVMSGSRSDGICFDVHFNNRAAKNVVDEGLPIPTLTVEVRNDIMVKAELYVDTVRAISFSSEVSIQEVRVDFDRRTRLGEFFVSGRPAIGVGCDDDIDGDFLTVNGRDFGECLAGDFIIRGQGGEFFGSKAAGFITFSHIGSPPFGWRGGS